VLIQLNPPIPVTTPKGPAIAHFVIDYGPESDLKWVCFQQTTGECWTYSNPMIRSQKNITENRDYISPFYDPDSTSLSSNEKVSKAKNKSLADHNRERKIKYETIGQTNNDFYVGQKVKIITAHQDFHFFDGETGVVSKIDDSKYLSIHVVFDEPRVYSGNNGEKDWIMDKFSFDPEDLCCLKKAEEIDQDEEIPY